MTLQPKDYHVAAAWFAEEIPLAVALAAITELFDERKGDDESKPILTLKACNRRVRRRWKDLGAFAAVTQVEPAPPAAVGAELENLAARLPGDLPERVRWSAAVVAVGADGAELDEIEARLRLVERHLLDQLEATLPPATRAAIEAKVRAALGPAAGGDASRSLTDQELRRRFGLPRLSLVG